MTHICAKYKITGSDNGLLSVRHTTIICQFGPSGTNFREISIKMPFAKRWSVLFMSLCQLDQSTTHRHLKSPRSISGRSLHLWCRGVVTVTAPPLHSNECIYAEFLTKLHVLISYLIGSEAKWPAFCSRRHFLKWKLNVLKSDRSFSTGLDTGLALFMRQAIV